MLCGSVPPVHHGSVLAFISITLLLHNSKTSLCSEDDKVLFLAVRNDSLVDSPRALLLLCLNVPVKTESTNERVVFNRLVAGRGEPCVCERAYRP